MVFDHGSTLLLLPVRSFLYQWLNLGQYGVFVFFLVSGYIVPASLERKGSVRGFWISRAFRLYPMFLVVLVLSAVAYETGYGTVANAGRHPLTAILGWLFMLQNLVAGLNVPVVTWTLSYEMVFYLLLAALFSWGIHRRSGWYATAFAVGAVALGGVLPMAALGRWSNGAEHGQLFLNAVTDALVLAGLGLAVLSRAWLAKAGASLAGLVALVLVMVNQTYPYPWSGCVILGLMFTGTMIYRAEQGEVGRSLTAAIAVGAFILLTVAGVWHGAQQHEDHHWQVQWATSVLLAGATFGIGLAVRNWEDPPLVRLARRDQLLGLPAAPARLRRLPLGPRAAPQAHDAGPGPVLCRAPRGDHRAQRPDLLLRREADAAARPHGSRPGRATRLRRRLG